MYIYIYIYVYPEYITYLYITTIIITPADSRYVDWPRVPRAGARPAASS